ncbi:hypothetical protein TWF730_002545 [Orbilia blumenaviensis]|uniref:Uncharacterized protein n=1 Tax=Orbilia blumenaviensis TaxID=1796055 RepID=A0AAV9UEM9_9PEZI
MRIPAPSYGAWLLIWANFLALSHLTLAEALELPHEVFQNFIEPSLKLPSKKTKLKQGYASPVGTDLALLRKITFDLKNFMRETPLRRGPIPSEPETLGSEPIFEMISETAEVINDLLQTVVDFEDVVTPEDYEEDPDLDVKHAKALTALRSAKDITPKISTFTIDTPLDFWKLTPIPPGSPDLVVWKALENLIIPLNIDIEDPVMLLMIWLGYTFEPNASGTSGTWLINPEKVDHRIRILESIATGIDKAISAWSSYWKDFGDAITNTAIELHIPNEIKSQMIYVIGGKLHARVKIYHNMVRKLKGYLGDLGEDIAELVEDIPEG